MNRRVLRVPDLYQVSLTVSDNYGGSTTATGSFGTFDPNNIVVTTTQDLTQPVAGDADAPSWRSQDGANRSRVSTTSSSPPTWPARRSR